VDTKRPNKAPLLNFRRQNISKLKKPSQSKRKM
jgi:hypothetical protein